MTNIEARIQTVYADAPVWKQREITRQAEMIAETDRVGAAFVWKSNGNAPFADMTAIWVQLGLASLEEADATEALRKEQTAKFMSEYVEARKNHVPSGEELAEMRAAFGPGETVVDVITGQRITL